MFKIKIFILILIIFYQSIVYSKSNSFNNIDSRNLSKYFSGIVALENKNNFTILELWMPFMGPYFNNLLLKE